MVQRLFAIMQIFAVVLFIMSTGEAAKTVVTDNLNYAGFRADCVPGDDFHLWQNIIYCFIPSRKMIVKLQARLCRMRN